MSPLRLTFAIPNYNGRKLLEEYLPSAPRDPERRTYGRLDLPSYDHVQAHVSAVVASGETVVMPVTTPMAKLMRNSFPQNLAMRL